MSIIQPGFSQNPAESSANLRPAVGLALVMLAICGGIYSATVTGISGALFPQQANGSLISQNGKLVGSALVAQPFSAEHYFHGRPSSVGTDPMATAGSNLAPSNPQLRQRVAQTSARGQSATVL